MADFPAAIANPVSAARNLRSTRMMGMITRHPLISLFTLALIARVLLVSMSSLFEGFVLDDGTYQQMATNMAAGDISHWDDFTYSLFWRTAAFLGPVTLLYKLFGPEIVVGQIYVAFLGAAVVVVAARLGLEFLPRAWALAAALVLVLLPSQAFWSSQLMKDASVWLALISLGLLVAIANRSSGRQLLVCGAGAAAVLCALAFLREHTLVVAAWALMIASLAGVRRQRIPRVGGAILLGVSIPWLVAASGPAGLGLVTNAGSLQELRFKMAQGANTAIVDTTPGGTQEELNRLIQQRQELEKDLAAMEKDLAATEKDPPGADKDRPAAAVSERERLALEAKVATLAARQQALQQPPPGSTLSGDEGTLEPNVAHLPRGLSVMLLEPFPIPFEGSASLRLARLESLLWYPLLGLAAIGLWQARSHLRALLFPIIAGGGILIMYALSEGNVGTAHRHRGEFVWVVVLLATLGLSHLQNKRNKDTAPDA